MARRQTNIEHDGTREFRAVPVRKDRNSISETRTFGTIKGRRQTALKKHSAYNKEVGLGSVNFSVSIVLFALIICMVILVAVYCRANARFF